MDLILNKTDLVLNFEVTTVIARQDTIIAQFYYECGGRQNIGCVSDSELSEYNYSKIAAIFRIHPFKGNLL